MSLHCEKCSKSPLGVEVSDTMIVFKCFYCGWRKYFIAYDTGILFSVVKKAKKIKEKKEKNMRNKQRTCEAITSSNVCGNTFTGNGTSKYCPECRPIIRRMKVQVYVRKFKKNIGLTK